MRLSDFILANLDRILDEWESFAKQFAAARHLNSDALRDHAKAMLQAIAKDLNTPQSPEEQKQKSMGRGPAQGHDGKGESAPQTHASLRAKEGFSIDNLIAEYRALRASVLRLWGQSSDTVQQSDLIDMTRFNEAIDQAVCESVSRYSAMVKEAQDLFLGILGHDLRNPLGTIGMSAQMLMQNSSLDSGANATALLIQKNSTLIGYLIDDLLDFARSRLGQSIPIAFKPMNLADVAQQEITSAQVLHPNHTVTFESEGDLNSCWDDARIAQVFLNLIGNAVKHGSAQDPVKVALAGERAGVVATVHNAGTPIPEEDLPHIFEPLRRAGKRTGSERQDSGLGLGLYIAQQIVHAHGGTLAVQSSAQNGTTFEMRLPRHPRNPQNENSGSDAG